MPNFKAQALIIVSATEGPIRRKDGQKDVRQKNGVLFFCLTSFYLGRNPKRVEVGA